MIYSSYRWCMTTQGSANSKQMLKLHWHAYITILLSSSTELILGSIPLLSSQPPSSLSPLTYSPLLPPPNLHCEEYTNRISSSISTARGLPLKKCSTVLLRDSSVQSPIQMRWQPCSSPLKSLERKRGERGRRKGGEREERGMEERGRREGGRREGGRRKGGEREEERRRKGGRGE